MLGNDTDANGDPLTAALVSGTRRGLLTFNSDGSFRYAPFAEFSGSDSFIYLARDGSGNVDQTPATYSWSVDVTSPDTSIASGPPNPTNSRDAVFVLGATEPGGLECKLDGAPFTSCLSPVVYSNVAEGPHTFQARATDAAGNVDQTAAQYAWTIDVTAPTTTIDGGPQGATNDPNATFSF